MESTKRFAITFAATVALFALPVRAEDQTRANTGVELREVVAEQDERVFAEADTGEMAYDVDQDAPSQIGAKVNPEVEYTPEQTAAENRDVYEDEQAFAGEIEESLIPRKGSSVSSSEIVRAGQTSVPWYRSPFAALLVVLGVIGAVAAGVKRWVPAARAVTSEQLRVVGRTAISSKQSAVLLHVGKRVVLLGVTPESVNTLSEITDESEVAQLVGRSKSDDAKAQGFDAATIASELPSPSGFDSALAREIEQYDDVQVTASHPEVEDTASIETSDTTELPQEEEITATSESTPAATKKSNGQPPKHLNDLLARLRSFQKS